MALYNVSNVTGANTLGEAAQAINQMSDQMFGIGLFLTVLIILFLVLRKGSEANTQSVLAITLLLGIIMSGPLAALGFIPVQVIVVVVVFFLLSLGLLYIGRGE